MTAASRHYAAWGLRIHSEIALPLSPADWEGPPDLRIRRGAVGETLGAPRIGGGNGIWEAAPGLFLLRVQGVARYLIREGREIVVDRAGGDDQDLTSFLLGSAFAACLQQRGVCTVYASAAAAAGGAVLFVGHSGLGKSTLLAAFSERGHAMLSDDVTGIVANRGVAPQALPAFPVVRLWGDAVEALGWGERTQGRVREGIDKHLVPVACGAAEPLPVRMVFVLAAHNEDGIAMETLPPADAFWYLVKRVYRKRYALALGRGREQFRTLASLVGCAPVVRVATSHYTVAPAALAERVEACLLEGSPSAVWRRPVRPAAGGGPRGEQASPDSRAAAGERVDGLGPSESVTADDPDPPAAAGDRAAGRPGAAPGGSIVWLASYPRSGNTWLRALLTDYLYGGEHPASIRALAGEPLVTRRDVFDEVLGLPSADLTPEELLRDRSRLHALLAGELPRPTFVKVHDACLPTPDGGLLFPPAATLGAVYVVRNPLDVAVSLAHFWSWPVERAVAELNRPEASLSSPAAGIRTALPQRLSTWSGHAASWLDQRTLPVHVVRYEDLLADPAGALGAVLRFAGLEPEAGRLSRAVEHARFERLRAQEEGSGFADRPPTARRFFRVGRAGSWRDELSAAQVRLVTEAHAPLMARFGYLGEAEAFLAGQEGAAGGAAGGGSP